MITICLYKCGYFCCCAGATATRTSVSPQSRCMLARFCCPCVGNTHTDTEMPCAVCTSVIHIFMQLNYLCISLGGYKYVCVYQYLCKAREWHGGCRCLCALLLHAGIRLCLCFSFVRPGNGTIFYFASLIKQQIWLRLGGTNGFPAGSGRGALSPTQPNANQDRKQQGRFPQVN